MEVAGDERELHAIEEELHMEILPGTEIMADIGSHHFVKGTGNDNVLVPQPSDDPHDPLNWTPFWKGCAITASLFATFSQGFGPLALAPMFPYYIEEFHCSLAGAVAFTGVAILILGFSNFLWVPISTSFGRRPAYIASQLICLGSAIWRAKAQTYNSFMGACILNGLGAGPAETLTPAVITDIFFLHDRGKWNTLYWVVYMGSLMVGPIISGAMSAAVGWRNFWWMFTGMCVLSLILIVFGFPETKYHRHHVTAEHSLKASSSSPSSKEETHTKGGYGASTIEMSDLDRTTTATSTYNNLTHAPTAARDPFLGRGSPSRAQWGAYQLSENVLTDLAMSFWIPWKMLAFPIVEFASFVTSWSCSSFLTLNLTQSQVFAAPPYNFNPATIGLLNFAILVGGFIGLATAGPFSDWVSMRATRRNRGIREPEFRLVALLPYWAINVIGNCVVAFGYQYQWNWKVIVFIGYTCAGIQTVALPSIVTTYAIDSYKPVAGSLLVSVTINKNVWGYGFSVFITPWIIKSGYIKPIMTNMALVTLWCAFGIVFWKYGKTFRRWSRNSSVHRM